MHRKPARRTGRDRVGAGVDLDGAAHSASSDRALACLCWNATACRGGYGGLTDVNVILAVRALAVDRGQRSFQELTTELEGEIKSAVAARPRPRTCCLRGLN